MKANCSIRRDFADARLTGHQHRALLALPHALPPVCQNGEFRLAAVEGCQPGGRAAAREPAPRFAHHPPGLVRLREAPDRHRAKFLADEGAADPRIGLFGDDDPTLRRQPLQPRGQIRCQTDDRVHVVRAREQIADDDLSGRNPDAHIQRRGCRGVQRADPAHDVQRCTGAPLRVVLGSDRVAEIGQDAIANQPPDHAAEPVDRGAGECAVPADDLHQVLGFELLTEGRGVYQVDEHDRHRPPLGAPGFCRGRARLDGRFGCLQGGDAMVEPLPLANRQPKLAQILVRKFGYLLEGDTLVAKRRTAIAQPNRNEPVVQDFLRVFS